MPAEMDETTRTAEVGQIYRMEEHGVTQGFLSNLITCPMKATWRYAYGLKPRPSGEMGALQFGDLFHQTLDYLYTHLEEVDEDGDQMSPHDLIDEGLDEAYEAKRKEIQDTMTNPSVIADLEYLVGTVRATIHPYYDHWERETGQFQWVDLERVFNVPWTLKNGVTVPVRGKFDGIAVIRNGMWLFETKTKGTISEPTLPDWLNYQLQVMLYLWAAQRTYDTPFKGVVYNLVLRSRLKQKVSETLKEYCSRIYSDITSDPGKYFNRYNHTILQEDLDLWVETDLTELMETAWRWYQGEYNYRNSGACYQWFRPCEYMKMCAYAEDDQLVQISDMYPELNGEDTTD